MSVRDSAGGRRTIDARTDAATKAAAHRRYSSRRSSDFTPASGLSFPSLSRGGRRKAHRSPSPLRWFLYNIKGFVAEALKRGMPRLLASGGH